MSAPEPGEQAPSEDVSDEKLATLADRAGGTATEDVTIREVRYEAGMGLAVIAFGVALIVIASALRQGAIPDPVTTRGMPMGAGVLIVVFAAFPLYRAFREWRRGASTVPAEGTNDEAGFETSIGRVIIMALGCFAWTFLIPRFSYVLMTPFFLAFALWAFGVKSWLKLTLVPILFTIVSWYLFSQVLTIRLPWGFLETWARTVGLTL